MHSFLSPILTSLASCLISLMATICPDDLLQWSSEGIMGEGAGQCRSLGSVLLIGAPCIGSPPSLAARARMQTCRVVGPTSWPCTQCRRCPRQSGPGARTETMVRQCMHAWEEGGTSENDGPTRERQRAPMEVAHVVQDGRSQTVEPSYLQREGHVTCDVGSSPAART